MKGTAELNISDEVLTVDYEYTLGDRGDYLTPPEDGTFDIVKITWRRNDVTDFIYELLDTFDTEFEKQVRDLFEESLEPYDE